MQLDELLGPVERPAFFNGQRLFAADLKEIEAFNRRMRWLHNLSLHQPGIGLGLAALGRKDDRAVTVQPGYAIDAYGREIILGETHVEPVPPVASGADGKPAMYDLTIAYPEEAELEEIETREGVCLPRGAVRLAVEPVFCWVRADDPTDPLASDVKRGRRLVLARVAVAECKLNDDIDRSLARRRSARPDTRPHIAAGREDTPSWAIPDDNPPRLMATVNTESGRFTTTPTYTARIEGPRPLKHTVDGPIYIANASHDGFMVVVTLLDETGQQVAKPGEASDYQDASNGWQIVWMGIED